MYFSAPFVTTAHHAATRPNARRTLPPPPTPHPPLRFYDHGRPLDLANGPRAWNDRTVRGPAGPQRRDLVWCELIWLRHARRRRVPDLHQRPELDRRSQSV